MRYLHIHYHFATGEIKAWDDSKDGGSRESHFPEHLITTVEIPEGHEITINHKTQKIDVLTGELIDKADDEQAHAHLPTVLEIKHVIATELQHSDSYLLPDRPLHDDLRAAWITYRADLRERSKLPDAIAMMKTWPARPDGADAISALRARILVR